MGITSFRITKYSIACDRCEKTKVCNSFYENVHSEQQAIKWAGMQKLKDGTVLCDSCFNKNKMVGKLVVCNNHNSKSCPYGMPNTRCDVHEPREKRFGEALDFYCLRGSSENPRHRKCKLVKVKQ